MIKLGRRRRGANAVEFALVAPLLFMMTFAIFEYGWLTTHQLILASSVSRGVRAGAVDRPAAQVAVARSESQRFWNTSGLRARGRFDKTHRSTSNPDIIIAVGEVEYTPITGGFVPLPTNGSGKVILTAASMAYGEP